MTAQQGLLEILLKTPVIPVISLDTASDAVPLARALAAGGLSVVEIALRTAVALDAIRAIASEVETVEVGNLFPCPKSAATSPTPSVFARSNIPFYDAHQIDPPLGARLHSYGATLELVTKLQADHSYL